MATTLREKADAHSCSNNRRKLGLALSGGGSRAVAFHCGTLKALTELHLLSEIDVVSTVSGGSLFGAAWATSIAQREQTSSFLSGMERELVRGFVARTVASWPMMRALFPGSNRTNALGRTFDRVFFHGSRLRDLPERPLLCMNATMLNNGQVAKFGRNGFRATGLTPLGALSAGKDIKTWLATVASASHPAWLPPVVLKRGIHFPQHWGNSEFAPVRIALTDGGVLENLGIQTLLKSRTYGVVDIISSDAGTPEMAWELDLLRTRALHSIPLVAMLCRLFRTTTIMSQKQDRHMRSRLFLEMENSRLKAEMSAPSRRVIMVRVDQTLERFLRNIPQVHLNELSQRIGVAPPNANDPSAVLPFLRASLEDDKRDSLDHAVEIHRAMGGDVAAFACRKVGTNFTALSPAAIGRLRDHAYWQTLACFAIYW